MPEIEGAGVALHYEERGDGAPLLIVHGMASDAAAWSDALDVLAGAGARAIAYDRRGYGSSGAPQPYVATTVQEQAEDAAALLDAVGAAPAILLGDGFGALVVLELLVRRPQHAIAAVLTDPPLFAFVAEATKALAAERSLLEQALREGGRAHAIEAWLAAAAQQGSLEPAQASPLGAAAEQGSLEPAQASPLGAPADPGRLEPATAAPLGAPGDPGRLERAKASPLGFFADYAGQASWSPSRRELRGIAVPVALVTGPRSAAHTVAAADAAAALLPGARRSTDGDAIAAALTLLR